MKNIVFVLLPCLLLNTGCVSLGLPGVFTSVLGGGAGAAIGAHQRNKPEDAAIGAGIGLLAAEGFRKLHNKKTREACIACYQQGARDVIKSAYWLEKDHPPRTPLNPVAYDLTQPAHMKEGVLHEAETFRIITYE